MANSFEIEGAQDGTRSVKLDIKSNRWGLNRGKVQRMIRRAFLLTVEAIAAFTSPAANPPQL
jgi:hypothetical protein